MVYFFGQISNSVGKINESHVECVALLSISHEPLSHWTVSKSKNMTEPKHIFDELIIERTARRLIFIAQTFLAKVNRCQNNQIQMIHEPMSFRRKTLVYDYFRHKCM